MANRVLSLMALLLLAGSVRAEDEIHVEVFVSFRDDPLQEAAEKIAACGQFRVVVDAPLRKRKVTLRILGKPPTEALRMVAAAAKGHVWMLEDGSYRIRATAQADIPASASKPEPEPAWKKAIREKLEGVEVDIDFQDLQVAEVLRRLARVAGVPIHLDPRVLRERAAKDHVVYVTQIPARGSVLHAVGAVAGSVDLRWDIRWGGVLVTTADRLHDLRERALVATEAAVGEPSGLRKKLAEKRISVNLSKSTVASALSKIARLGGVKIRYESKKLSKLPRVVLAAKDMALGDALDVILVPRGLELRIEKGALVVKPLPPE